MAENPGDSSPDLMERYLRFILRHRVAVLVIFLLLSLLSVASLSRAIIASSVGKLFLGESPKYQFYLEQGKKFGSDEILVFGIEDTAFLSKEGQERLVKALTGLRKLKFVRQTDSYLTARRINGGLTVLNSPTYAQLALANPDKIAELKQQLSQDILVGGTFVAKDGESFALLIELTQDKSRSAEEAPIIVAAIKDELKKAGYDLKGVHSAGLTVSMAEVISQTRYNIERIFPFTAILLLLTVWLLFRRLWPAALSLSVAFLGVLWTMGFAIELDRQVNVMMSAIPIIVLIVAFSDVVHLCSAYLLELADGKNKEDAIIAACKDVGRACIYTSLTTFVGFVGMSFVPTPVFRLLGITLGLGVGIALFQAITLVPILFSFLGPPKLLRAGPTAYVQRGLDWSMTWMQDIGIRYSWLVIVLFGGLLALSFYGISKIRVETNLTERLAEDNPARLDQTWFQSRYNGSNFIDIYVEAPKKSKLLDPEWIQTLYQWERQLELDEDIDSVQSYVDILAVLNNQGPKAKAFGKNELAKTLPKTQAEAAQAFFLIRSGAGKDFERLVSMETGFVRLMVRIKGEGFRTTFWAGERADKLGQTLFKDGTKIHVTGLTFILGDWLDNIIAGQRRGLLVSIAIIAIMMMVCFRSISVGLWSMIPNLLPLFAVGGWCGLTWDTMDSDTFTIGLLAIGIGVDDTIHFLSRYRAEMARGHDRVEALKRTFAFAGRAIIMTTLIFVAGVLPFVTSDYFTT
ncbi:MAG: efflux RND transporter permease subunit, partial [Planctomycetota bacterium]|nr:efflux RND transporter permease subunit [Planctomycetota bacterium]